MRRVLFISTIAAALAAWLAWSLSDQGAASSFDQADEEAASFAALEQELLERLQRDARERTLPGLSVQSRGVGVLKGKVVRQVPGLGLKPLAGVAVLALWHPSSTGDPVSEGDPAARTDHELEDLRGRATVLTQKDGTFLFERTPAFAGGALVIRHAPYRDVVRRGVHVRPNEATDLGEIVLGAPTTLRGEVTDSRGRPIADARVQVLDATTAPASFDLANAMRMLQEGSTPVADVHTGGDGTFRVEDLPPGIYTLRASARNYATAFRGRVVVSLDEQSQAVRMILDQGIGFEGTIRDATGTVAGARVIAIATPTQGEIRIDRIESQADAEGRYQVLSLVPNTRYFIEVVAPGYAPAGMFRKTKEAVSTLNVRLVESGRVTGRVLDADTEAPIEGARVMLASGTMSAVSPLSTISDAEGRYTFERAQPGPVLLLSAVHEGFAPLGAAHLAGVEQLMVRAGETLEVDRRLAKGGVVTGRVTAPGGAPVAYATVGLQARRDRWLGERTAVTDDKGTYRIAGVRAGEHQMRIDATGFAPLLRDEQVKLIMPADLAGVRRDVLLDPGAVLEGIVTDPEGAPRSGATVEVSAPGANRRTRESVAKLVAVTHPHGGFRLFGVPPNLGIRLIARHDDFASRHTPKLTLQAGEVRSVDLQLRAGANLPGRVEDASGAAIPDAHIRWGVVRPEDERHLRDAFRADALLGARVLRADNDGRFTIEGLAPGKHLVKIERVGFTTWYRHDIVVPEDDDPAAITAVLEPAGEIRGRVRILGTRAPVADAYVYAREPRGEGEPRVAEGRVRALVSTETDASGAFLLPGLAPGNYEVVVWFAPGCIAEAQDWRNPRIRIKGVAVGASQANFDLDPIPPVQPPETAGN